MSYGQSPWQSAGDAMQGVGQSMANVMMAGPQQRFKQQQFMAQQALERAYLDMARQKQAQQGQLQESQIKSYGVADQLEQQKMQQAQMMMDRGQALGRLRGQSQLPPEMLMNVVRDPRAGGQLFGDLRSAGVMPQGQADVPADQLNKLLAAAMQSQMYQQAGSTPASAERLTEPVIMQRNTVAFDPVSQTQIPGMVGGPGVKTPHEEAMEHIGQERVDKVMDPNTRAIIQLIMQRSKNAAGLKDNSQSGAFQQSEDILGPLLNSLGYTNQPTGQAPAFDTENAARAQGHKAGDKVRIKGVGLVQLN